MARANWYLAIASFILWFVTQSPRRQKLQNPKIPVFSEENCNHLETRNLPSIHTARTLSPRNSLNDREREVHVSQA